MTEARPETRVVLVALDASPLSLAALETAAKVASRLNAELRGMYVEDIDLLRTAALPFACAITSSGQLHPLTPETMERQMRRQATIARNAVEAACSRSNISGSFSVVRGTVYREITRAASTAEVVTVGRFGWSALGGVGLGSVARSLLAEGHTSLLMVAEGGIREPLAILYDGSPSSKRALTLASTLDGQGQEPITIIVAPEAEVEDLQRLLRVPMRIVSADLMDLQKTVERSGAKTVFIPDSAFPRIGGLLERMTISVFLVR